MPHLAEVSVYWAFRALKMRRVLGIQTKPTNQEYHPAYMNSVPGFVSWCSDIGRLPILLLWPQLRLPLAAWHGAYNKQTTEMCGSS